MAARTFWLWIVFGACCLHTSPLHAAPPLPPPPDRYVADRAGVLSPATRKALDDRLAQFERDASSQIVVWLERKLPPDATLEGYAHDVFRHWRIGQGRTNNGILLALFVDDRKMRIEVGRGLEGALPDALAGRILENEIRPRLRAGDYDGGVRAGVAAIIAATRGEYRGIGTTVRDRLASRASSVSLWMTGLFGIVFVFLLSAMARRAGKQSGGWSYHRGGWSSGWGAAGWGGGGWSGGGGGGFSGGGGDSGGGGGFSGGGGDSGGGGASGSW